MMKNVLFIVNSLGGGGAERVCVNLANKMADSACNVKIITVFDRNDKTPYRLDKKIEIYNLGYNLNNKFEKLKCLLFAYQKINRYIKGLDLDWDLITSHLPMSNMITRRSSIGKKAIYVLHSTIRTFSENQSNLFKAGLRRFFKGRKVCCVSDGIRKECLKKYGFSKKNTFTIYNPLELRKTNANDSSKKLKINNLKPFMLVVGRLNQLKRQDRAIKIFEQGEFYKKLNLVFCGDGELIYELTEQAKNTEGARRIHFVGWQNNVSDWIKNAEVLLCTSDTEGFPMNLVEGVNEGVKIVSADCAFGPNEILTGEYAKYLVRDKENISEYVDKINLALEKYPSSKNPIIEKCSPEKIVDQYFRFYKKGEK